MKKITTIISALLFISTVAVSQDTLYIYQSGAVVYKRAVSAIDSIIFYQANPSNACGISTVSDIDGNIYNVVSIGNQCWMKENLKTTKFNNNTPIANVTNNTTWQNLTTPGYCWYNDSVTYGNTYGALYNWYTVNAGNLCPIGWHVPSDAEWKTLEMELGMSQSQADSIGFRGTNEGSKLAGMAALWAAGALKSNVEFGTSGFSALPGGTRFTDGVFGLLHSVARFWATTEYNATDAWLHQLCSDLAQSQRNFNSKTYGFNVRCIKD
jgi:uncharacterized protein (TIGR02145 family)